VSLPTINQPRDLWECDGSYRDVYIQQATLGDWEALCKLGAEYGLRYWCEGIEQDLPAVSEIFGNREHPHLMTLYAGLVRLNCHFFVPEEIELDIDPREIRGPDDHYAVLGFLERLSTATNKKLLITAENSEDMVLLQYEPTTRAWVIHEPPINSDA
jgi:hypothetical protein